jgi:hypothetical protein
VRDLVFVRDEVFQKDTKTTGATDGTEGTGTALKGPPVNFGYETTETANELSPEANEHWHVNTPELVLPGLKCLQSPIVSRSGELERSGHRITGACTFYAPSLDYILAMDNFSDTSQFNELETYDKLYDMERIIEKIANFPVGTPVAATTHTIRTFDDATAGYQIDRLQFKIKSSTPVTLTSIKLLGIEATARSLVWSCVEQGTSDAAPLALSSAVEIAAGAAEYITIDVPLRDIKVGDTTSLYKDGVRTELRASTDNTMLDIDKLYGAPTYDLSSLLLITSSGLIELKDIYLYKEAEWRVDAIKEYRDEYLQIGAVRVRGDRGSRRRTYG